MHQKTAIRSTYRLFLIILLLGLLLSQPGGKGILSANAQSSDPVCFTEGTVDIPLTTVEAIKTALTESPPEMSFNGAECFAVIDSRDEGEWLILSLVGLSNISPDSEWTVSSNGVWSDSAIVHQTGEDIHASIAGTQKFSTELAEIPESIVPAQAKAIIDPLSEAEVDAQADGTFRFPFQLGYQVYYGTKGGGVHPGEFTAVIGAGSLAVDLLSDGNTGANHAPNQLVAVAGGTVVKKCSDTTKNSTYIVIDNGASKFLYAHLRASTAPALWAVINNPGDSLGEMVPGTFNDGACGYASQTSGFFHVHLEFPATSSLTLSDWTLNTSTEVWQRGGETWSSGQWKQVGTGGGSGGTGIGCDQVSYNGVVLYQNATCNKDQNGSKKEFSSSTGWTDIVSDFNDITSSIYIKPGWSMKVFEKSVGEGGGSWRCLTGSMWDLNVDYYTNGDTGRRINDDISSVQVFSTSNNCGGGGGGGTGTWNAKYFNGHDHWWDTNNFNNEMCQESITSTGLDKNYGSSAPCGNGVTDNWVAEYNATINFPSGNYVFQAQNDDGLKLWLNGNNILERGGSQGLSYICPARPLNGNATLRAILNEEGGDARIKIAWTTDTSICNLPGSFSKASPSNAAWGQPTNPTLTWNSSSGANNYSYCIDTSNNNSCDTGWVGVGNVTSKSLSGLATGATYYWQVRAHSEGGETYSNGNAWWSFTTQTPVPSMPSNFRISSSTQTGITLAWNDVSNETGYNIYEWNGADFVYLASVGANATSYTETRAACGWDEFYQVSAYNGNGESDRAGWIQGYTKPCNPTLNTPGNGSSNPHNYDLTFKWNSAPGATEYLLEWWGGPYSTMQPCGWSSSTFCAIGNVFPGNTYSWRVKARNSAGESNWSTTWTFKVQAAPVKVTLYATAEDGWVLESSETSNKGSSMNAASTSFVVGDDAGDKQYRGVLSFNTAGLPDNAVITSVTFKVRQHSVTGTNPFSTHGNIAMDIIKGAFSGNTALQAGDFQATASRSAVATITNTPYASWYSKTLGAAAYAYINKGGVTQFRLRFGKDDNDDRGADYLRFYSGNATTANRPRLVIQYYIP